jgi:hypothetical protein
MNARSFFEMHISDKMSTEFVYNAGESNQKRAAICRSCAQGFLTQGVPEVSQPAGYMFSAIW